MLGPILNALKSLWTGTSSLSVPSVVASTIDNSSQDVASAADNSSQVSHFDSVRFSATGIRRREEDVVEEQPSKRSRLTIHEIGYYLPMFVADWTLPLVLAFWAAGKMEFVPILDALELLADYKAVGWKPFGGQVWKGGIPYDPWSPWNAGIGSPFRRIRHFGRDYYATDSNISSPAEWYFIMKRGHKKFDRLGWFNFTMMLGAVLTILQDSCLLSRKEGGEDDFGWLEKVALEEQTGFSSCQKLLRFEGDGEVLSSEQMFKVRNYIYWMMRDLYHHGCPISVVKALVSLAKREFDAVNSVRLGKVGVHPNYYLAVTPKRPLTPEGVKFFIEYGYSKSSGNEAVFFWPCFC